ncbi:WD domain, G-beta repeat [Musa troglodytarum]|uniref:WD domain, G-beta repeat n=1 Tax=Musa troglodytarum TaxID=320322 RepID=A0A9E7I5P3_9LILI|nr:WD domain, G-beta repeat [Musa troglodytarum]
MRAFFPFFFCLVVIKAREIGVKFGRVCRRSSIAFSLSLSLSLPSLHRASETALHSIDIEVCTLSIEIHVESLMLQCPLNSLDISDCWFY